MINCELCNKTFLYNSLLVRHLSNKVPCFSNEPSENSSFDNSEYQSNNGRNQPKNEKETHNGKLHECSICLKCFCNKKHCERHIIKCTGCHILQCPICKKEFKNSDSKSYHKRKVRCIPFVKEPQIAPGITINNTTNNDNSITNNNTTNNFINVISWSDECYDHVTPKEIARLISTKCCNYPVNFFAEFPKLAHRDEHANLRCTNMRGQHIDVYQDGKFKKVPWQMVLDEATKRMCHRVDDAYNEDEEAFKRCRPTTEAIVNMEDVINDSGDKEKSAHHTRVMGLERRTARTDILAATRSGLYE